MDLIKALKHNEKPFGLMTQEMQDKAKEIGRSRFQYYRSDNEGEWHDCRVDFEYSVVIAYRLKADYTEESGVIECDVFESCGQLVYRKDGCYTLSLAVNNPNFIGYKYEGYSYMGVQNHILSQPWVYSNDTKDIICTKYNMYTTPVHATHVLLRSKP